MKKTAVFMDNDFIAHDPGSGHVESPDRLHVIYQALEAAQREGKCGNIFFPECPNATRENLLLNHTQKHIQMIEDTANREYTVLGPDTRTNAFSYNAATKAAGAVVAGIDMVVEKKATNAFTLVRPPGHHAEKDKAMGFCLFNNIAIGAAYAVERLKMDRVMIIDWDLHHGNGTQHSFYGTDKVLYCSTHQYPFYPGTGGADEVGAGKGKGYTVNVPLQGGQDNYAYATVFRDIFMPIALEYKPELVLVSAGFDIYQGDPLGTMLVTEKGFANMTRIVLEIAEKTSGGRVVFALEGGYSLKGLRDGVLAVLGELSGTVLEKGKKLTTDDIKDMNRPGLDFPGMQTITKIQSRYWTSL